MLVYGGTRAGTWVQMPVLATRTASFYNNASVSPSLEQLIKDRAIYAESVTEQISVACCNYVLFLSPFLASCWMVWEAVMVITEKLHLETRTRPLSNSQKPRSRDKFLLGVMGECWCERWPSWVSEENAVVTRTFIIVSATVGIATRAMMTRKSLHALCTVRQQQWQLLLSKLSSQHYQLIVSWPLLAWNPRKSRNHCFWNHDLSVTVSSLERQLRFSQTFGNSWLLCLLLA